MEPPTKKVKSTASRRAPYAASACDSCHGRKLKCSGDRPCARCKAQDLSCSYPTKAIRNEPSFNQQLSENQSSSRASETLLTSIDDLQRQLDDFRTRLHDATASGPSMSAFPIPPEAVLRRREPPGSLKNVIAVSKREPDPGETLDVYAGPTSFAWGMVTADARLANLTPSSRDLTTTESPSPGQGETHRFSASPLFEPSDTSDVQDVASLENFTVEDVLQSLDVFQAVYGVLHAVPQIEQIKVNAPSILRSAKRSLFSQPISPGRCGLLEMTKVILATALVAQTGRKTTLSDSLYESVVPIVIGCTFQHTITYDFRTLLLLVAIYHFTNEDLVLGSRAIILASRTAIEQGLYRIETLTSSVPDQKERQTIIRQLWSLFVLDRQFNFAAGLPHHLNESDVDLPPPVDAPYLTAMVSYVIMGAQGWNSLVNRSLLASGQLPSKDASNYFRYQVHHWQEALDPSIRFDAAAIESDRHVFFTSTQDETEIFLKTLLYLRSNQIQILVLRPILIYPQTARSNTSLVLDAVTLARKTIRTLNALATKTDLYRTRQAIFNHFLSSSLAVLFLTAAYDAETQVNRSAHPDSPSSLLGAAVNELQTGLDLIDRLRANSQSAARLWARFDRPRQQLIRLGILSSTAASQSHNNVDGACSREEGREQDTLSRNTRHIGEGDINRGINAATENNELDFDPTVEFDLDIAGFEPDNGLLWQDWFDGGFMDSSVPFGMPAWM